MRSSVWFAAVGIVLLTGCHRKAEGETAAVVNGQEITLPDLNYELRNAKVPEGADQKAARNEILRTLIDRSLLVQEARKEGLDKTPEFLNRSRRTTDDLLISMLTSKSMNTAQIPSDQEIAGYISSHPGMFANREVWGLQQLIYNQPTDQAILKQIEATKTLEDVAGVLQSHNIQFSRQQNKLDTAAVPADLYGRISTLPAGEPFIFPVSGRAVASVIVSKEPKALVGDAAKPIAVAALRKEQAVRSVTDRVKELRGKAKVEYAPGFEAAK